MRQTCFARPNRIPYEHLLDSCDAVSTKQFSNIRFACLDFCTICCVVVLLKLISRTKCSDAKVTQNWWFYAVRIYGFLVVALPIFTAINFKILKCGTDCLFNYSFDSQICILTKYLGGASHANMSSAITSPVKSFLQKYLCELLKATKEDGCKVIGYSVWSLMDNFEWSSGYTYVLCACYVSFSYSEFEMILTFIQ